MQQSVYHTEVEDVNDLRQRLIDMWADVQQSVIDDTVIDQWYRSIPAILVTGSTAVQNLHTYIHKTLLKFLIKSPGKMIYAVLEL